jgi:hypothetical protein
MYQFLLDRLQLAQFPNIRQQRFPLSSASTARRVHLHLELTSTAPDTDFVSLIDYIAAVAETYLVPSLAWHSDSPVLLAVLDDVIK